MNTKHEHCHCGKTLKKLLMHESTGWITMGYYCKSCEKIFNTELMPMVTYRAVQWQKVIERTGITIPDEDLPKEILEWKKELENSLQKNFDGQVRQQEIKEAAKSQEFVK